jgi:hypothetical protein
MTKHSRPRDRLIIAADFTSMLMRFAHRPRACFLCFQNKLLPNFPNSRNPPGGGNDVGFAALMEADIDLGFTALKAAADS